MHGGTTDLIEVHSVSASYDGLAISEKIPRNTKPGSKVIQIALNCFVGHTGVSDKQNAARSIGLDYRLNTVRPRSVTTVFLLPWKPRLVANAKVQGHAWRDLEFILEESLVLPDQRKAIRCAKSITHLIESPYKKICHGKPRAGSGESGTSCAVATDQIEVDVHPLVAPLEGVRPSNESHGGSPVPVSVRLPLATSKAHVELTRDIKAHPYAEVAFVKIHPHVARRNSIDGSFKRVSVHKGVGRFIQEGRAKGVRVRHGILLHIRQVILSYVLEVAWRGSPMIVISEIVEEQVVL